MDAAHQDAVARAKAIAARLAGMPAAVDYTGGGGGMASHAPAPAPGGDVNSQAMAALEAAFGTGGGGAAPSPYAPSSSTAPDMNRKRGVEDALASLIPGLGHIPASDPNSDANKRFRTDGGGDGNKTVKKLWIPSDRNPGYNYVGLLIGPGGSKQRELIAQSGGDVRISIRGRGSSSSKNDASVVPGAPEEPLHVLLEGSAECVGKAENLVRTLLEDSEAADKEKARQLGSLQGGEGGEQGGGGQPAALSSGGYTPKPVAQILGLNGAAGGGMGQTPLSAYGPGGGGAMGGEQVEEKIGVPNGVVGFIIGRGGESITSMQRRTGCKVQIQKEHEMAPGTAQRVITLTAATADAIAQCRAIIESMVMERLQQTGATGGAPAAASSAQQPVGPGSNAASQMLQLQKALSEGQAHVTVQVPDADVGLVIGKSGMQIRNIQEKSGANVQIPQVADANNPMIRTVNITHPNIEGANFAKQMIEEIMNSKVAGNQGGGFGGMGGGGGGGGEVTIQVNCPDKDVGMIIGRGGCVIKQMQQTTRCRIQIPPTAPPGSPYRIISVIGPQAGCEQVKEMIERIVSEQSSQSVMTGVAFSGGNSQYGQQQQAPGQNYYGGGQQAYGQQQQVYGQQQQATGYGQAVAQKTDYSAEWAAYYAAQAAAQQGTVAAAGTAAATAPAAAAPAAAAAAQPAHDAYYKVFWEYAAYYGEEAARKHYGAWSPPVGTPNPNAGASAGATASAPAPSSTATAQPANVTDSSVRRVSNLPAWMTKS